MNLICKNFVEMLKKTKKTVSCMESCTGGCLANEITNISGASEIIKVSLVTYSNEYKIKFGVDSHIINEYTVYSTEVAEQMARKVSIFADSDYGIGITGHLNTDNRVNIVYYSVYSKEKDININGKISISGENRDFMKKYIANKILEDTKWNTLMKN